jgi:flagellar hook assembly protein FlgD
MSIYDVSGRRVITLVDADLGAGIYNQAWDGRNAEGARVSAGTYFIRLDSNGQSVQQKLIHIR